MKRIVPGAGRRGFGIYVEGEQALPDEEGTKRQGKFIGFVEPYDYGWRASFRTLKPGAVFSQEGSSKVFPKEPEAVKWLHLQAGALGFTTIDIRRKSDPFG